MTRRLTGALGLALSLALGAAACDVASRTDKPSVWTLADLVAIAEADGPYVDRDVALPDGGVAKETVVPMTAVVTPPGAEVLFRSPPFAAAVTTHTGAGPLLNVLPGLSDGRAIPYATIELWTNDFGPVWIQPMYWIHAESTPAAFAQPIVFTTNVGTRFYSPFWRLFDVYVPDDVAAKLAQEPVKSVAEVMALGGRIVQGGLVVCPLVPEDVELDPALLTAAGEVPAVGAFPGVWDDVYRAEYTDPGLARLIKPGVLRNFGFVEGQVVSALAVGGGLFRELPGEVVESVPIFMWVDLQADGSPRPLALPPIGGHAPLFSGDPVSIPGGTPDWFAMWDLFHVVRPAGAEPFLPGADGDAYAELRTVWKSRIPAADVQALPGVIRYLGRMALDPGCFDSAAAAATGNVDAPISTTKWAATCRFVDSQLEVETLVPRPSIRRTGLQILCPFLLWARAAEVCP